MPLIVNTLQGLFELRAAIWRCFPQLSLSPVRLEQPAGKDLVLESGSLLTVRSETGKSGMMILTLPAEGRSKASRPSLEFQRYGSDYFLTKI